MIDRLTVLKRGISEIPKVAGLERLRDWIKTGEPILMNGGVSKDMGGGESYY